MTQVLSVASEAFPLVKTGGLADVVGSLPGALAEHGITVTTLLPGYPEVRAAIGVAPFAHRYGDLMGAQAQILSGWLNGHPLLVLDAPALFDRKGGIYGDSAGIDWHDNWRRFAALSRAVCGVRGQSVILNLPGKPSGAVESLVTVIDLIPHVLRLLAGDTRH